MAINTTFLENSSEDNNLSTNPIGYFVPVSVNGTTVTIKDKSSTTKTLTYDTLNNQLIEDSSGEIFVVDVDTLNVYYEISDITINGDEWNINMVVDKLDDPTDHDYTHLLLFISDVIESEVNVDNVVGYVVNDERFKYGNNVSFSNTLIKYDDSYPYLIIELNTSISFTKELNYDFQYNVKMLEDSEVSVTHVSDQRESSIKEFTELYTYNALNDIWLYMNKFIKDTQFSVSTTTSSESGSISILENGLLVYGQNNPNGIAFDFGINEYNENKVEIIYKEETIFDSFKSNRFGTNINSNFLLSFDDPDGVSPYIKIELDNDNIINLIPYEDRNDLNSESITGFNLKFGEIKDNDIYDRDGYIKSRYVDNTYFDGIDINGISELIFNNRDNVSGETSPVGEINSKCSQYFTTSGIFGEGLKIHTYDDYSEITYLDTVLSLGYNDPSSDLGYNNFKSSSDGIKITSQTSLDTFLDTVLSLGYESSDSHGGYNNIESSDVGITIAPDLIAYSFKTYDVEFENNGYLDFKYYDSSQSRYRIATDSALGGLSIKNTDIDGVEYWDASISMYYQNENLNSDFHTITSSKDRITFDCKISASDPADDQDVVTKAYFNRAITINSTPSYLTFQKDIYTDYELHFGSLGDTVRLKKEEYDDNNRKTLLSSSSLTISKEDTSDESKSLRFKYNDGTDDQESYLYVNSGGSLMYNNGVNNKVAFKSDTGAFTFTTSDGKTISVTNGIITSYDE